MIQYHVKCMDFCLFLDTVGGPKILHQLLSLVVYPNCLQRGFLHPPAPDFCTSGANVRKEETPNPFFGIQKRSEECHGRRKGMCVLQGPVNKSVGFLVSIKQFQA